MRKIDKKRREALKKILSEIFFDIDKKYWEDDKQYIYRLWVIEREMQKIYSEVHN